MLERKTFCVVTGASRGLGLAIAQEIAPKLGAGSVLAVMARTRDALEELKQQLEKSYPKLRIHVTVVDLGTDDEEWFTTIFQKIVKETSSGVRDFEQALLINNAAILDDVTKFATDLLDKKLINYFVSMNFTSMVLLTTHFLKLFSRQNTPHRCIVNISSVGAAMPFRSLALYCSCKAARLMFCKTLCAEEPDVKVLCYNPGMLDTGMQLDLRTISSDPELREIATALHEKGILLTPTWSAAKLLSILEEDNYRSGEQIDIDPVTHAEEYSTYRNK